MLQLGQECLFVFWMKWWEVGVNEESARREKRRLPTIKASFKKRAYTGLRCKSGISGDKQMDCHIFCAKQLQGFLKSHSSQWAAVHGQDLISSLQQSVPMRSYSLLFSKLIPIKRKCVLKKSQKPAAYLSAGPPDSKSAMMYRSSPLHPCFPVT